jgi:hypothetical protein
MAEDLRIRQKLNVDGVHHHTLIPLLLNTATPEDSTVILNHYLHPPSPPRLKLLSIFPTGQQSDI